MNFKRFHESKNLFDEAYPDISGTIRYRAIFVGDGTFTLSTTTPYDSSVANVFLISGNVSSGASTPNNGAWLKHDVTTQSIDGYVTIAYRHYTGTTSPVDCQTMLNLGSTHLPYEPYGDTWTDTPHYIHNTSTDTITTLPTVLYPNDTTATVGLKGQMEQSSQPSPTTPIQPQETGDRTGNLFDSDVLLEAVGWTKDNNIYSGYSSSLHSAFNSFDKCIPVDAAVVNMSVMFMYANLITPLFIIFWYTDGTSTKNSKVGKPGEWTLLSVNSDSNKTLKGVAFSYGTNDLVELKEIMLNTGSTALPYEPYGYFIEIEVS